MIVSWNWLKEYVLLDMSADDLVRRVMMAGLNHEGTHDVDGDLAIDLEITSNRPDCLGHIGIAREIAVLFERALAIPDPRPKAGPTPVDELTSVIVECPTLCPRYTARVIRGVKVGASPAWLRRRLATLGVASINNVVDVTNYVLFECGQPLHAFDLRKLRGGRIVVREPRAGEKLEAIDHKTYDLAPGTCLIADAEHPVGIAGIMGGAETEVTATTTDLLIEAALFDPMTIRNAARWLNLHSDSSHRFERGLDPEGVDWASRRACQLIVDLAGGELAAGVVDVGHAPWRRHPVVLRLSQLPRILGIEIPTPRVRHILAALGNDILAAEADLIEVIPPSWRADLSREIDLVEEVARIHGYEAIPEDVQVPMAPSARSRFDRVVTRVRSVMTATGFDEAYTLSTVEAEWSDAFSPWTHQEALESSTPVLRRANRLRRSLVPSLLGARRTNEALANERIELFEIAKIYLARPGMLPEENWTLALTSGADFAHTKGVVEALLAALHVPASLEVEPDRDPLFVPGRAGRLRIAGQVLGFVGEVSDTARKQFDLRGTTTVAEVRLQLLDELAQLVPQYARPSPYPAMARDVNLVVPEAVRWSQVAQVVRTAAGALLERLEYRDTYRDAERLGADRKSLLFSLALRDPAATLTSEAADRVRDQVVAACRGAVGAQLRE